MSAVKIPNSIADLFEGKAIANLATVSAKGQPMVMPVWVDREGDRILINSAGDRVKNRHMTKGAHVALAISDPANPYRYVGVQGRVLEVRKAGADAHIDKLSQRYLGKSPYPWRKPGDTRELFVIEPTHIKIQG